MAKKLFTSIQDDNPFKKVYSWTSPERHWVKKDRAWYLTYSFFFVVLIAFLALLSEYIYILAVLAFAFLWFAQAATPPQMVEHTITSLGIRTQETFFKWSNIKHFWFSEKSNILYLNLETIEDKNPNLVKRVSLLLNPGQDEEIFNILIKFIDYGSKQDIGYNILLQVLQGEYFDSSKYLAEDPNNLESLTK